MTLTKNASTSSANAVAKRRLALGITAVSAFVSVIGAVYLLRGHPEGGLPVSAGVGISLISLRFAKDANDRLDKLATELKDE